MVCVAFRKSKMQEKGPCHRILRKGIYIIYRGSILIQNDSLKTNTILVRQSVSVHKRLTRFLGINGSDSVVRLGTFGYIPPPPRRVVGLNVN